jgi:ABC-type multidrug transport system fused ATPase/permease subunit
MYDARDNPGTYCGCILTAIVAFAVTIMMCFFPFWVLQLFDILSKNDVRTPIGQIVIGAIIMIAAAVAIIAAIAKFWTPTTKSQGN